MKLILASNNANKLREFRELVIGLDIELLSQREAGCDFEVEETGTTFEENAYLKAYAVTEATHCAAVADDSGLCVDALDGEPGIHSARFMGHDTSYDIKNAELLKRLEGTADKDRTARFVCAVAAILPSGKEVTVRETMEGRIAHDIAGANGFGYDPIFFLPEFGRTSAEISPESKNLISHRGKALRHMRAVLEEE